MSKQTVRKSVMLVAAIALFMAIAVAQTSTTTTTAGASEVKTLKLSGTVLAVEGAHLMVQMASGDVMVFTPPANRTFKIDGKDIPWNQAQPGTKLQATYTEIATQVTDRTVQSLTGKVIYVSAPTVILQLPSGEARKYFVKKDSPVKFYDYNKKEITVFDLKKGMNIEATKITEAPRVELMANVLVTGTAPVAAAAPAPAPEPAPAPVAAPEPAPAPAPAPAPEEPKMPKTASPLPLVGLLGLFLTGAALGIRMFRR